MYGSNTPPSLHWWYDLQGIQTWCIIFKTVRFIVFTHILSCFAHPAPLPPIPLVQTHAPTPSPHRYTTYRIRLIN